MREIKFRAWDKKSKRMRKVDSIAFDELTGEIKLVNSWGEDIIEDKPIIVQREKNFELLQYTGLKDKNGKEIYGGDIIEGGYLNPLTNEFYSRKYIIEYKNATFAGKLIGHSPYGDTWLNFIHGEVIGNIYENPELLEVEL